MTDGINVLYSGRLISTVTPSITAFQETMYQCPLQRTSHFYEDMPRQLCRLYEVSMSFTADVSFLRKIEDDELIKKACINVLYSGRLISTQLKDLLRKVSACINVLYSGRLISTRLCNG